MTMKYMGAKTRIAKEIVPIIQRVINANDITHYIEPFCGGCNIIDKIACESKTAADINPYLIGLFKHLQSGGELLPTVSRELYSEVREKYKQKKRISRMADREYRVLSKLQRAVL